MKIIMTKGLPASGKSTWARQYVLDHPDYMRVNKDELRQMIHAGKWSKSNERQIMIARDLIIQQSLKAGNSIIVDDTNFAPAHEKRFRELAIEYGAKFEIKDFTDVNIDECIARDQKRPNYVGEKIIRKMYSQYLKTDADFGGTPLDPVIFGQHLDSCVVFDVDGTLACIGDRNPYDSKNCLVDKPNHSIIALNKFISRGDKNVKIFVFSGRSDDSRKETIEWLRVNQVFYDELFMRQGSDNRKDAIIKQEMFDAHIKGKYNVLFAVDDRNQVVRLWRSLGITCLQVAPGDF